jgi:hypothetical protein
MLLNAAKSKLLYQSTKPLIGDYVVIITCLIAVIFMFVQFWSFAPASKLKIRLGNNIIGTYDLNQTRELAIKGPIGISNISINQGKVRFKQSPCKSQYCVHQGWLSHAGQVAICLPNQISLQLMGAKSSYDSLNY